jgi:hypothetical protein
MTWGVRSNVVERFTAAGADEEDIDCTTDVYTFNFAGTPAEYVDAFRRYYGPTMNAFDAAAQKGAEEQLREELEALFDRCNVSTQAGRTVVPANFMRVTVRVR